MPILSVIGWCKQVFKSGRGLASLSQLLAVFVLGVVFSWWWFGTEPDPKSTAENGAAHMHDTKAPQKWTCSMHPYIQKDKAGKCPICAMDLIPLKTGDGQMTGLRQLAVSPAARALMNIDVFPVERRYVETEVRMVGKVDYDETRLKHITAWVSGRLDRLFVDFTGTEVKKGYHLVYIYSEELYAAQQELIEALKSARLRGGAKSRFDIGGIDLVESSREKLRLLGLTQEQINEIEQRDKPSDHMTIYSPMSGIVIEKLRQAGDRVRVGDRIYTVADLNQVWVKLDAYESDLVWIRYGQQVEFTTEAYPGETFLGRIAFIDPVLDEKTRTVKVRVNVPNLQGKLKPKMFVRAIVRAKVAGGGRVIDPDFSGKWISPMHPEIVKDQPGVCDICGMPLVRAESLGYVTPQQGNVTSPLVIPASAALVTGTRAVVYVQMPNQPDGLQEALQALGGAIEVRSMSDVRAAFASVEKALTQPNDGLVTASAKRLWDEVSSPLKADVKKGRTVQQPKEAEEIFTRLTKNMETVRDHFGPANQSTFEGRVIVLGPRAGDYYLVKHGLQEGELVVTRGNFKIDAEIQIQAKPSVMTPEGGGGGGHDHGGHGESMQKKSDQLASKMELPVALGRKLQQLNAAYQEIATAYKKGDSDDLRAKYDAFGKILDSIDATLLSGHTKMQWREFSMLLGNDVAEGRDVSQIEDIQRVFQSLAKTMKRVDAQFDLSHVDFALQRLEVPSEFQAQLLRVWDAYTLVGQSLAADRFDQARQAVETVSRAVAGIDMKLLKEPRAHEVWMKELANLRKILQDMSKTTDIKSLRNQFAPLSGEMRVLVLTFGVGESKPVYLLHCPMAFGNKGAIWLQKNDQTRNPYFGSTMLKCADRVERIAGGSSAEGQESRVREE
jgi:multidrug efflux pump subunit AcrA (membrane-fusion protein)